MGGHVIINIIWIIPPASTGKKTPPYAGPVTFGEVACQLLNQTLVHCEIV